VLHTPHDHLSPIPSPSIQANQLYNSTSNSSSMSKPIIVVFGATGRSGGIYNH
jgi:hypothetical protein